MFTTHHKHCTSIELNAYTTQLIHGVSVNEGQPVARIVIGQEVTNKIWNISRCILVWLVYHPSEQSIRTIIKQTISGISPASSSTCTNHPISSPEVVFLEELHQQQIQSP